MLIYSLLCTSSIKFIDIAIQLSGIFRTSMLRPSILGHLRLRKQIYLNIELPYKQEIERSTSGRGARASYRTMVPEISARRSLLEPSFRYLSAGSEGEKCRPLDHVRQIPFIHSDQFLLCNKYYIYVRVYHLSLPCGTY